MAVWAADCAERVLSFFENACPEDDRPRKAIETCRTWVRTGVFKMAEIRGASLAVPRCRPRSERKSRGLVLLRVPGEAVATAHVPQHAFGSAYYALKAIAAADPVHAEDNVAREHNWQVRHIPAKLRAGSSKESNRSKARRWIFIKVQKDQDY